MYLGSDNYLGPTAYLGPGPNTPPVPTGDETLIQWRDITLHGLIGRFTISDLAGWDDLPDSRQQWDPRPNQHGTFDAPVYASERHIMVAGACFDRAQRDALLAEMKRAMTFGAHAEELAITHAGQRLTVAARLVRFNATHPAWGAGYWGWQAEWVAPDPYRYGSQRMAYTGLPVKRGGLRYPLFTDGTSTSTVYAWTGTPGASTSTKSVDGVVVRENLAAQPWGYGVRNASVTTIENGVAITDHPLGIATAHESRVTEGETSTLLLSSYNVGGGGDFAEPVWAGTWVKVNAPGYQARMASGELYEPIPANEWVFIRTTSARTGWIGTYIQTDDLRTVAPEDRAWLTGTIVSTAPVSGPEDYFDGDTPDEIIYGGNGILDYGEASDSGRVTLRNDGDADASPTFQVRGPAPQGVTIANIETGRRIVSTTVIPAGSTLTIHTAKGTAYLDGADRSGQLTVREWTPVPPEGERTFQFSAPTYTSAALVGSVRDTHW